MEAQKVLMVWKAEEIDVHVSVRAVTEGADFSWVLPVAAAPKLALGDSAVFEALDAMTRPTIDIEQEIFTGGGESGFCGMTSDASGGAAKNGGSAPIQVESGTLGNYEYDIVSASSVEEMLTWLEDDGYAIPEGASGALAPYVAAKMSFVWVKLGPKTQGVSTSDLQPLILTVPRPVNSELSFPLALSAGSASPGSKMVTHLYMLADKRYRVTNYGSTDLEGVADSLWEMRFDSPLYEDVLDSMTEEAGGRLMVTEFARDLTNFATLDPAIEELIGDASFYLTRLHARTSPESLADATLTFAHEAPEVAPFATAKDKSGHAHLPLAVLLVLLGLLGWSNRAQAGTAPQP
jgi:hypothetical protein